MILVDLPGYFHYLQNQMPLKSFQILNSLLKNICSTKLKLIKLTEEENLEYFIPYSLPLTYILDILVPTFIIKIEELNGNIDM